MNQSVEVLLQLSVAHKPPQVGLYSVWYLPFAPRLSRRQLPVLFLWAGRSVWWVFHPYAMSGQAFRAVQGRQLIPSTLTQDFVFSAGNAAPPLDCRSYSWSKRPSGRCAVCRRTQLCMVTKILVVETGLHI